jgi:hypothetical protein
VLEGLERLGQMTLVFVVAVVQFELARQLVVGLELSELVLRCLFLIVAFWRL